MSSYTNVFGGNNVDPADLGYAAFTIAGNLTLVWPFEAVEGSNVAAQKMSITATAAGLSVYMPQADRASNGQDALIKNTGAITFSVVDNNGTGIVSIASGEEWFIWITNNSTAAGTWDSVQFGMGTSSATAASLAGAGLRAHANRLDQNIPTNPQIGNYSITAADRATVVQSNGGSVTYTFGSSASLGDGFLVYVINMGSGSLTLTPAGGETIDDSATKVLQPDENCIVFSDGSNLHSLGYGRSVTTTVTAQSIAVGGTGVYTLSASELAARIQDYSGTLTGNRIVDFSGTTGYWFVFNNTSGAFSLTFRTNSLDAGVAVARGSYSIIRSNGTAMSIAFTATSGTLTQVNTGTGLTGGPITSTGTIAIANTAVTAGSYGGASKSLSAAVNAQGQLTSLAEQAIAITASQVTDLASILAALVPTGTGPIPYVGTTAPSGWIFAWGTIGNGSSGATNRANADTVNLFTLIWNGWANAQAAVSGGRGASAAADYAANKTIAVPDMRGRLAAFLDNMGGSAASRLTSTTMSPNGTTIGATGGAQTGTTTVTSTGATSGVLGVSTTSTSMDGPNTNTTSAPGVGQDHAGPSHTHANVVSTGVTSGNLTVSVSGMTSAFSIVQPTMLVNAIIKL